MEPVIFDQSPLAEYLRDENDYIQSDWIVPPESVRSNSNSNSNSNNGNSVPSSRSPSPPPQFAPVGRPTVSSLFRSKIRQPLRVDIPGTPRRTSLRRRVFSAVVASTLTPVGHTKFLEQFRYTIVASQLLSGHAIPGQRNALSSGAAIDLPISETPPPSKFGILAALIGAFVLVLAVHSVARAGSALTWRQNVVLTVSIAALGLVGLVVMRKQYLERRKNQALAEILAFIAVSYDLDGITGAAIALVQEVELVSRGYRISAPLPPISRIEERSQARKCIRLRKALRFCYADVLQSYAQTTTVVKAFSDSLNLEKYYDIYDISDLDISDAFRGFVVEDFEDVESLRTLKILAARLLTMRKILLCAMLALDADGGGRDILPWTTAVEALRSLNKTTRESSERLRSILSEEESFPVPSTPKMPSTPGRERWRAQMRKLNSLSGGIRGLQAKLQLLREESGNALDESTDLCEVGKGLITQYDSIGADLGELMRTWEEGRAVLVSGIDRNEKRLSSLSTTLMSPATSWSGLTTVEEGSGGGGGGGTAAETLKVLTGEEGEEEEEKSLVFGSSDPETEEVYEAMALPTRPRSMLSRDERLTRMRDDREKREAAREAAEASRGMMKELESVIKPRARYLRTKTGRVVSM